MQWGWLPVVETHSIDVVCFFLMIFGNQGRVPCGAFDHWRVKHTHVSWAELETAPTCNFNHLPSRYLTVTTATNNKLSIKALRKKPTWHSRKTGLWSPPHPHPHPTPLHPPDVTWWIVPGHFCRSSTSMYYCQCKPNSSLVPRRLRRPRAPPFSNA